MHILYNTFFFFIFVISMEDLNCFLEMIDGGDLILICSKEREKR